MLPHQSRMGGLAVPNAGHMVDRTENAAEDTARPCLTPVHDLPANIRNHQPGKPAAAMSL